MGWGNRTLTARDYKPICPQLTNYMFDETHNGYAPHAIKTDEDCLFLNVWTPQVAIQISFFSLFLYQFRTKILNVVITVVKFFCRYSLRFVVEIIRYW